MRGKVRKNFIPEPSQRVREILSCRRGSGQGMCSLEQAFAEGVRQGRYDAEAALAHARDRLARMLFGP
jgi:hypothetical protein